MRIDDHMRNARANLKITLDDKYTQATRERCERLANLHYTAALSEIEYAKLGGARDSS